MILAGTGSAPKARGQRRNHAEPQRGEWVTIAPLAVPVLPGLPRRAGLEGPWSLRTKRAWEAWRSDPASGMYGPAEVQGAIDLAYVYEQWVRDGTAALASEIRQRQDILGLSAKGKQDRRWRVASAAEEEAPAAVTQIRRLKVVATDAG